MRHRLAIPFALALLTLASQARAHAHLVASEPAAGAKISHSPAMIDVQFSERLEPKFSGFDVTRVGAKVAESKVDVGPVGLDGPKGLMAMPKTPLATGAYVLHWHAVSADGHRTEGDVPFAVK